MLFFSFLIYQEAKFLLLSFCFQSHAPWRTEDCGAESGGGWGEPRPAGCAGSEPSQGARGGCEPVVAAQGTCLRGSSGPARLPALPPFAWEGERPGGIRPAAGKQ